MNITTFRRLLAPCLCLLMTAAVLFGCGRESVDYTPMTTLATEPSSTPTEPSTEPPTTEPPATEPPTTEPQPVTYTLSFAGDCTLGADHGAHNNATSFPKVVGDQYDYPFQNALPYFQNDDFTIVNFEGVLCTNRTPVQKTFRFRGPVEYAKILTAGNIEAVNLSNNHTLDYGTSGYKSTLEALAAEKVTYVEDKGTAMYTTQSGLKIGLYAGKFQASTSDMKKDIKQLREDGAEIVIVSFHWGTEYSYRPSASQKSLAHAAIDAGANIVYGHHPHVLQPVEKYKDGMIYYSLGNFSFGGNRNPSDKDTAVIQQLVIRDPDGTVRLGETKLIPFRLSSVTNKNDYKPTPYATDDPAYTRTMSKLDGTFKGKDGTPSTKPTTEPTTEPTEPSSTPTDPSSTPTEPSSTPSEPSSTPTEPSSTPTEPTGGASGELEF